MVLTIISPENIDAYLDCVEMGMYHHAVSYAPCLRPALYLNESDKYDVFIDFGCAHIFSDYVEYDGNKLIFNAITIYV